MSRVKVVVGIVGVAGRAHVRGQDERGAAEVAALAEPERVEQRGDELAVGVARPHVRLERLQGAAGLDQQIARCFPARARPAGIAPPGASTTSAPEKPTTRQGTASSPRSSWAGCPSLSALANPVAILFPIRCIGGCETGFKRGLDPSRSSSASSAPSANASGAARARISAAPARAARPRTTTAAPTASRRASAAPSSRAASSGSSVAQREAVERERDGLLVAERVERRARRRAGASRRRRGGRRAARCSRG